MAKWLFTILGLVISTQSFADVNSQVAACLSGQGNSTGGSQSSCIQTAINAEETNQSNALFQNYANIVNQQMTAYDSTAGVNTPVPGSGAGSAPPGAPNSGGAPDVFSIKPKAAAPTQITPPTAGQVQTPSAAPPISQTPKQAPQNQGGIQYY